MTHKRAMEVLKMAQVFCPAVAPTGEGFGVYSALRVLGRGSTIAEAMGDAQRNGHIPQPRNFPIFRGDQKNVVRFYLGSEDEATVVAVASSRTYADRIANALNQYLPNERGF